MPNIAPSQWQYKTKIISWFTSCSVHSPKHWKEAVSSFRRQYGEDISIDHMNRYIKGGAIVGRKLLPHPLSKSSRRRYARNQG